MKVRRNNRLLVSALCTAVAGGIAFFVSHVFNDARRSAVRSTIASIQAGIHEIDEAAWEALHPAGDWRELPPESVDVLLDGFYRKGRLDVGPSRVTRVGSVVDPWGNRYHVRIRTVEGSRAILVWSLGRDGRSGTSDDILLRDGDTIPVRSGDLGDLIPP